MWVTFEQEKTRRAFSNALYLRKKLYAHTYKSGMDMDKYLDDMEAMRRQLRNMNDEISDTDMVKLILQGVAFEYRGVVRMFDKDVRDGNMPLLSEVLNTLRSEAEIDKQRNSIGKKANKSEEAKILQVKQQQQFSGAKGKRRWKQNKNANMKKKFKARL
ncbi:hypothetical protein PF011_g32445 [Phytophthora fragariae]|uniref:Retrotransposon gag domain-containing protein n=1 Tax=Phytophthora fragariae TaxID=53985 RepID=A0A6A3G464_9STRA|nr:hypothetical protein PF011_g32445 [Phytophthora fragariae]